MSGAEGRRRELFRRFEHVGCVYCLRWQDNPRMYIGVDGRCPNGSQRYKEHLRAAKNGSKLALHNAIRKYGAPHMIILFRSADYGLLLMMEIEFIDELGTYRNGWNMTPGGETAPPGLWDKVRLKPAWISPGSDVPLLSQDASTRAEQTRRREFKQGQDATRAVEREQRRERKRGQTATRDAERALRRAERERRRIEREQTPPKKRGRPLGSGLRPAWLAPGVEMPTVGQDAVLRSRSRRRPHARLKSMISALIPDNPKPA